MSRRPPPPHHCRICGDVLNVFVEEPSGEVHWFHGAPQPAHEPEPVPTMESPSKVHPVCDFCSAPNPPWGYLSADFAMGGIEAWRAGEGWSACDACADLIDAGDWDGLTERTLHSFGRKFGGDTDAIRPMIAALHSQFRDAKMSGRVPVGELSDS